MRAASWLMERFGVSDPIVGDLTEQSGRRSRVWLWRQTAFAVLAACTADIVARPFIFAAAIVVGWLLVDASYLIVDWLWAPLNLQWSALVIQLGLRHQHAPLTGLLRVAMGTPLWFAAGWLVRRIGRMSTPVAILLLVVLKVAFVGPEGGHVIHNGFEASRFVRSVIVSSIGLLAFTTSVITGALWSTRRHATL